MDRIDPIRFRNAQKVEMDRWRSISRDAGAVQREIDEHAEIGVALRRTTGARRFERGLEVGVGPLGLGFLGPHFSDLVGRIDGLDPLPRLDVRVDDAALQARVDGIRARVNYVRAQAEAIPAGTETYDLVSCINVVDHAQSPASILLEINRVLKPGGILAFAVSTLSLLGESAWQVRQRLRPEAFLFAAHPHTFQWRAANSLLEQMPGTTLWRDGPGPWQRLAGHGRMSFWIRRKHGSA